MALFPFLALTLDIDQRKGLMSALDRARVLPIGHSVVALACFNPEDPNSALLTHLQVRC